MIIEHYVKHTYFNSIHYKHREIKKIMNNLLNLLWGQFLVSIKKKFLQPILNNLSFNLKIALLFLIHNII